MDGVLLIHCWTFQPNAFWNCEFSPGLCCKLRYLCKLASLSEIIFIRLSLFCFLLVILLASLYSNWSSSWISSELFLMRRLVVLLFSTRIYEQFLFASHDSLTPLGSYLVTNEIHLWFQLRSALDPKRHYKKGDSRSKTLPKYFQASPWMTITLFWGITMYFLFFSLTVVYNCILSNVALMC